MAIPANCCVHSSLSFAESAAAIPKLIDIISSRTRTTGSLTNPILCNKCMNTAANQCNPKMLDHKNGGVPNPLDASAIYMQEKLRW